jgi:pilus assembly protein CpaE
LSPSPHPRAAALPGGARAGLPSRRIPVPVRILASARSSATLRSIGDVLADVAGVRPDLRNDGLRDLLRDPWLGHRDHMLILDLDLDDDDELAVLDQILGRLPQGLPVIATSTAAPLERMRLLMRLGVVDFLPQPIVPTDLVNSIELAVGRLARTGPWVDSGALVVGFGRPCGGMGATTLAVQSAFLVADRLGPDGGVCLIDFNLQNGNAGLYLDIDGEPDITDCLVSPQRIDPTLVHGVTHRHRAGFDVIPAPERPLRSDDVPAPSLEALFTALRQEYALVIVDLPPLSATVTGILLSNLDVQVLVMQSTVPAIRQARRHLDLMAALGFAAQPVRIVVNRYERRPFARAIRLKEIEQALGRPVDAALPSDYATVSAAIDSGIAITEVKSRSPIAKGLRRLMDRVLDDRDAVAAGPETPTHRDA